MSSEAENSPTAQVVKLVLTEEQRAALRPTAACPEGTIERIVVVDWDKDGNPLVITACVPATA